MMSYSPSIILNHYNSGLKVQQIADLYGVSRRTIFRQLKKARQINCEELNRQKLEAMLWHGDKKEIYKRLKKKNLVKNYSTIIQAFRGEKLTPIGLQVLKETVFFLNDRSKRNTVYVSHELARDLYEYEVV